MALFGKNFGIYELACPLQTAQNVTYADLANASKIGDTYIAIPIKGQSELTSAEVLESLNTSTLFLNGEVTTAIATSLDLELGTTDWRNQKLPFTIEPLGWATDISGIYETFPYTDNLSRLIKSDGTNRIIIWDGQGGIALTFGVVRTTANVWDLGWGVVRRSDLQVPNTYANIVGNYIGAYMSSDFGREYAQGAISFPITWFDRSDNKIYYARSRNFSSPGTSPYNLTTVFNVVGSFSFNTADNDLWLGASLDFKPPIPASDDPYNPGGTSGPGGGTGNFDGTSDDIGIPSLPTLSAVDTGLITLFNPSISELQAFANWIWNDLDINNWHKMFTDPMEAILGLSIVPVAVPDGGVRTVSVGNIFSVGISMNVAATQYVEVDCGTLNVNEFWGAYLDYDPFTKAEIYLPYIGIRPLKVDDIMAKPVHVVYHVDILSGGCTAFVQCGGSVLYTYVGQCAASVPIAGKDWTQVINGVLQIGTAIGTMIATEGAATPFVAGMAANGASAINKPNVEKSGGMSGAGGILAVQTPYIILTRPRQALPAYQNAFEGYPSLITATLGELTGYTEIESVHLDGIPATREEIAEIESLLKGGVIL